MRKDAIKDTSNKQPNEEPIIISNDTDEELPQNKKLKTMNANII